VSEAREVQHARFREAGGASQLNAEMTPNQVREFAQEQLAEGAGDLIQLAVRQLNLSARAFHRLLKLARTIADLDRSDRLAPAHVAEAIQYRERVE
jgi:magnesium chelatase family protein